MIYKEPVINVYIPYEPEKRLGQAYNRVLRESAQEWNLLLDWDVLLLNPDWYNICQRVILSLERNQEPTGIISAVTNVSGGTLAQKDYHCPKTADIHEHRRWSLKMYRHYGETVHETRPPHNIAGLFILTNKKAWAAVGGFKEGLYVDFDYSPRVAARGFKIYVVPGLYVYHATPKNLWAPWPWVKP